MRIFHDPKFDRTNIVFGGPNPQRQAENFANKHGWTAEAVSPQAPARWRNDHRVIDVEHRSFDPSRTLEKSIGNYEKLRKTVSDLGKDSSVDRVSPGLKPHNVTGSRRSGQ